MTKDEIKTRLESAEKQMNDLQKEIADLKVKLDEAREIPDHLEFNIGDVVWYIDGDLKVYNYTNCVAEIRTNYNNFYTPKYAKELAKKCHEIAMLLYCKWHIDRDYEPNWDDDNDVKFSVMLDHSDKDKVEYAVYCHHYSQYPTVYFSTKEAAQKAADWMNEHCLMRKKDEI